MYPLIAVTEVLRSLALPGERLDIYYLGPKDAYQSLFTQLNVKVYTLLGAKIRRYMSIENLFDIPKFFLSLFQAFWKMFVIMPDAVFSKGGSGALPVVFAAWFFRVPVVVHESDTVPGLTNKISAKFAKRVALSFESAMRYFPAKKAAWTGHPMRRSIVQPGLTRERAKTQLGFLSDEPLVVVVGGSQGSVRLNEALLAALPRIVSVTQVLHQAGVDNSNETEKLAHAAMLGVDGMVAARHQYKVVPYLTDIGVPFQAADIVLTRAGSGSIFELAAFGRAAILVPLPESANDHQKLNAISFAHAGGGTVVEQQNLVPSILAGQIDDILEDPAKRAQMEERSRAFAKDGGAELIAAELLRL